MAFQRAPRIDWELEGGRRGEPGRASTVVGFSTAPVSSLAPLLFRPRFRLSLNESGFSSQSHALARPVHLNTETCCPNVIKRKYLFEFQMLTPSARVYMCITNSCAIGRRWKSHDEPGGPTNTNQFHCVFIFSSTLTELTHQVPGWYLARNDQQKGHISIKI